jgi:hypothetical protein
MLIMKLKCGEIFSVMIHDHVRYFQYLHDDSSQLSSNVIKIFKARGKPTDQISYEQLQLSGTDFYAHVMIKVGIKFGSWKKYSFETNSVSDDVWYRDSPDYGNPDIKVTEKWWLWQANKPRRLHNISTIELLKSHIGIVISSDQIIKRLECESFQFFYPKYPNQI